ncbi:MAG: response regulator [Tychonema bourrellyi B0820]|uniref:histidine kinase n=1 Tax=Tychonema bourrellyi FEM_GT703 TaxID=2040638 RepID=A0A2G4EY73_9CYAN|nr:response regulator [Tychonema bourrellyi]MDQ2098641.1 response regulator [Tychonema bourrellyi B0820]PHX54436.1 hybrid sensor histidine kinase/response regulator [Tychonema bourrellyi FEM_GT703]
MSTNQKYILVVDDNPTNLAVISQALKTAGYKLRVASEGEEALTMMERCATLRSGQTLPELILLDVQMPGIDGFETCRRLQANPATKGIPVIFMTALTDAESKVKGLSLGAVDYITKPFEREEVLARVKVHWRLKELTDRLEQEVAERTASLQHTQLQLIQQEKLSTLGQLVAGVAHEINNPLSFVVGNIAPAKEYLADITELLNLYQQHYPQPVTAIADQINKIDLEFALEDFAKILDSMQLGTERIQDISLSLRNFARSSNDVRIKTDLHQGMDSTLMLLKHRLKDQGDRAKIEVIKHYGNLPEVDCYPGPMNQVFMNLFANAIDALEEAWEKDRRFLKIQIDTEVSERDTIIIQIADNALGMTENVRQNLFKPLFTTKTLGKGTGLGLSIAQQIVVDKHCGKLLCQSTPDKGTEFRVEIPL